MIPFYESAEIVVELSYFEMKKKKHGIIHGITWNIQDEIVKFMSVKKNF